MAHQHNEYDLSWQWKENRNRNDRIAEVLIDDTVVELKMEERRPSCFWVSFVTKYRGSTRTELIFMAIADVIEEFVKENDPLQISFNGDKPIKAKTYQEHLLLRCPKYGYEIIERGTDDDLLTKVFTMKKVNGE